MKVVLHTESLTIGYKSKHGEKTVADGISLSVPQGKLVALIGANGIGKSTLLRTLVGIQPPLLGSVWIDGQNLSALSPLDLARKLSVVLTDKLPPSNLSVHELVALGRQPYTNWIGTLSDSDRAAVDHALTLTQTASLAHRKHHEISDGQLQKVLIARALAQDTPLIVLDEPTTHLDLVHKVALLRLLEKLTRETGKTVLYSTHDLDLALQLSDQIIAMTENAVDRGTPQELIAQGVFDRLFPDDSIQFDRDKAKFVFKSL